MCFFNGQSGTHVVPNNVGHRVVRFVKQLGEGDEFLHCLLCKFVQCVLCYFLFWFYYEWFGWSVFKVCVDLLRCDESAFTPQFFTRDALFDYFGSVQNVIINSETYAALKFFESLLYTSMFRLLSYLAVCRLASSVCIPNLFAHSDSFSHLSYLQLHKLITHMHGL